jgi:hypothetical protein
MTNPLSQLWARVTGLKEWDKEVKSLHNTVDDDTPAPGTLPGKPLPSAQPDLAPLSPAEFKARYEGWEGEEPGLISQLLSSE